MVNVTDEEVYQTACGVMQQYRATLPGGYQTPARWFMFLLAVLGVLPGLNDNGNTLSSGVIERRIDQVFRKVSQPANACVLDPLNLNYHALSRAGTGGQNTWRNHLGMQKGARCYASVATLSETEFIIGQRLQCPHLQVAQEGTLAGAACSLAANSPHYDGQNQPKWIRQVGGGYQSVDLSVAANWSPQMAVFSQTVNSEGEVTQNRRVPLLPFLVVLYHDSPGQPTERDISDFMTDFDFDTASLQAVFDPSPENQWNAQMIEAHPQHIQYTPVEEIILPPLNLPPPPPPQVNTGYAAEMYIQAQLEADGWTVTNVSRLNLGWDLEARRGNLTRYIEVKSSVNNSISPTMTDNEWQAAQERGVNYWLALITNFRENQDNEINWVQDPHAVLTPTANIRVVHSISQTDWRNNQANFD
jgi:hypothetical protein